MGEDQATGVDVVVSAEVCPPNLLPELWQEEIAGISTAVLCPMFRKEWVFASFHHWRAVLMLARIADDESWRKQTRENNVRYHTINEWVLSQGLPGLTNAPTVSRILSIAKWFVTLTPQDRLRWVEHSIWDVVEVLPVARQVSVERAYEIVSSPITARAKREEVRREVSVDQHHDVSGCRNLQVLMSKDDYDEVRRAVNAAKHMLQMKDPSDSAAVRAMASDFLSGFTASCPRIEPLFDVMPNEYRRLLAAEMFEDVLAGKLVCIECGSWVVQRHHCPPRSRNRQKDGGGMWSPDDPEWPCVYLCAECHRHVHTNVDGTWPTWAEKWKAKDPRFAQRLGVFTGQPLTPKGNGEEMRHDVC